MKKFFTTLVILSATIITSFGQEPKVISDCTITYDVSIQTPKAGAKNERTMGPTTKIVYLKGSKSRSDIEAAGIKITTFFDARNDSTIILKEAGNNKFISYIDKNKRKEKNRKFDGVQFTTTNEKKTILGYECEKVIAKLADGSTYNVFYSPSVVTMNNVYEYQFKDLAGLVLEYDSETEDGKSRITYTATKISLLPVPTAKFDIPKSGYRVL